MNVTDPETYLNESIVYSYYGTELKNALVQSFNVSFGEDQDGFYSHTNYTTW